MYIAFIYFYSVNVSSIVVLNMPAVFHMIIHLLENSQFCYK